MASILVKSLNKINLLNISKKIIPVCSVIEPKRNFYTLLEKEWIKQNNQKLKEQMRNERGIELKLDPCEPQLYFEKSEELKNADDVVKKILSLEYANRVGYFIVIFKIQSYSKLKGIIFNIKKKNDYIRKEEEWLKKIFQKLPTDDDSLEIQIAKHTLHIKRMIKHLDECGGKNKRMEFLLYRQFHRRNRLMIELFEKDNHRYQFVIDKLNMKDYKLIEKYPYKRETRYTKMVKEIKAEAREKRLQKLRELKEQFDKQKALFYEERERVLKEIQEDISKLRIRPNSHIKPETATK